MCFLVSCVRLCAGRALESIILLRNNFLSITIDDEFAPLMLMTHTYVIPSSQFAETLLTRYSSLGQRRWELKVTQLTCTAPVLNNKQ